jgi:adenine-specific DNA-methyltransferase
MFQRFLRRVVLAKKTPKKNNDVEAYGHETETRKNVVLVGLASYDTSKPKPKKYEYNPRLDPQLVWTGKAENTSFEVSTVFMHIPKYV